MAGPRCSQRSVILPAAQSTLIVPENRNRKALLLSNCDPVTSLFLGLRQAAVQGAGLLLPPANRPLDLFAALHGDAASAAIFGIASAGLTVVVWEFEG